MAINYATGGQLGIDFSAIYTPSTSGWPKPDNGAPFTLGQEVTASNGSVWVYCLAAEALAAYATVSYDAAFSASQMTKTLAGTFKPVGFVSGGTAIPSASYGWVCVGGENISILGKGGSAKNAQLYTTTSAGVLSGTSTSQTLIAGVIFSTSIAPGATTATAALATYPRSTT